MRRQQLASDTTIDLPVSTSPAPVTSAADERDKQRCHLPHCLLAEASHHPSRRRETKEGNEHVHVPGSGKGEVH